MYSENPVEEPGQASQRDVADRPQERAMDERVAHMRINQQASEEGGYPGENDEDPVNQHGLYEVAVSLNSDLMDREIVAI